MCKSCIFYSSYNLPWKFDVEIIFPAEFDQVRKQIVQGCKSCQSIYHRHMACHFKGFGYFLMDSHFHRDNHQHYQKETNMVWKSQINTELETPQKCVWVPTLAGRPLLVTRKWDFQSNLNAKLAVQVIMKIYLSR